MHHPTDRITHTTAFFYTNRGTLAGRDIAQERIDLKTMAGRSTTEQCLVPLAWLDTLV